MSEQTLRCTVTRYSFVFREGEQMLLAEKTREETTGYKIERGYLFLGNSAASAPVEKLRKAAGRGANWLAQAGTAPVCVDGHWGGRNYPAIMVGPEELLRVLGGAQS